MRQSQVSHCRTAVPWGALPRVGWWGPWVAAGTRAFITFLYAHGPPNLVRSTILQRREVIIKASKSDSFLIAARPPQFCTRAAPVSEAQLGKVCFFSQGGCRLCLPQGRGTVKFYTRAFPQIQKQNDITGKPSRDKSCSTLCVSSGDGGWHLQTAMCKRVLNCSWVTQSLTPGH